MTRVRIASFVISLALAQASLLGSAVAHADGFRGDHDAVALEHDLLSAGYGGIGSAQDARVEGMIAEHDTCPARAEGSSNEELADGDVQATRESQAEAAYTIFAEEFHFCPDML